MYLSIHTFNKYLLILYCVLDALLDAGIQTLKDTILIFQKCASYRGYRLELAMLWEQRGRSEEREVREASWGRENLKQVTKKRHDREETAPSGRGNSMWKGVEVQENLASSSSHFLWLEEGH